MGWWLLWAIKCDKSLTVWLLRRDWRRPCQFYFFLLGCLLWKNLTTTQGVCLPWESSLVTGSLSFQWLRAVWMGHLGNAALLSLQMVAIPVCVWLQPQEKFHVTKQQLSPSWIYNRQNPFFKVVFYNALVLVYTTKFWVDLLFSSKRKGVSLLWHTFLFQLLTFTSEHWPCAGVSPFFLWFIFSSSSYIHTHSHMAMATEICTKSITRLSFTLSFTQFKPHFSAEKHGSTGIKC